MNASRSERFVCRAKKSVSDLIAYSIAVAVRSEMFTSTARKCSVRMVQVEGVKWAIVSGIVGGHLIIAVRNLGYSRNAGEFVKEFFGDIGSAGGHRALAKAVIPAERFRAKFGDLSGVGIAGRIGELAEEFLADATGAEKKLTEKTTTKT